MPKLLLIKHAPPLVDPAIASSQWKLSQQGRLLCTPLADRIRRHDLRSIIASEEPKARETAKLLGEALSLPVETAANLHEHDRRNVPHMRSSEFISNMELFFRRPDDLVLGEETANQAEARFTEAVSGIVKQHAEANVAIVSHGTVIAIFLAQHGGGSAFDLWRKMGLPSVAVLSVPDFKVEEIVERIAFQPSRENSSPTPQTSWSPPPARRQ